MTDDAARLPDDDRHSESARRLHSSGLANSPFAARTDPDENQPSHEAIEAPGAPTDPNAVWAVPAGAPRRFCERCGAAWLPEWTECHGCVARPIGMPTIRPHGSLKSPLALYFILLSTFALIVFADNEIVADATITIADSIIVLVWCVFCWRSIVPIVLKAPKVTALGLAVLLGVASFSLAHGSAILLTSLLDLKDLTYSEHILKAGYGWSAVILLLCVQPPLIEELAFRGIILDDLRSVMVDREAIIVSAMMFMILHLSILSLPYLLAIGILAAWLRIRTGSIWPCVLLHCTHNSLVLFFEYMHWT